MHAKCLLLKKTFYFVLGVELMSNVIVSVNSEGTQPYIYMYPFSPKLPSYPACDITLSRVLCVIQ